MALSVLIVEDEPAIQELLSYSCVSAGMEVRRAGNVAEARKMVEAKVPDLVLLDWMLPDCPGLEWLRQLRHSDMTRTTPVIMVTARSQEDDRVAGLEAGADDYIIKPFSPRELIARIKAVNRRKGGEDGEGERIECGPLVLDTGRFEATVNGELLKLGVVEFKVLCLLAKHPGRVYSRQQLIERVWGYGASIDERTVDVHVLRLRKHLAGTVAETVVDTVRGLGYRAIVPMSSP